MKTTCDTRNQELDNCGSVAIYIHMNIVYVVDFVYSDVQDYHIMCMPLCFMWSLCSPFVFGENESEYHSAETLTQTVSTDL
jgi:hypothetical protein